MVTCGPAYAPLDGVRRITNHSTGKLGVQLANRLARSGWQVTCFRGEGATYPEPLIGAERIAFTTNEHLQELLGKLFDREDVVAVFHAAALSDYRVKQVTDADGAPLSARKLPSREGELTVTLEPAPKLIKQLRLLFPNARLIGWKYELEGTRAEAVEKGWRQIADNGTDLCIVNGDAYGEGFAALERAGGVTPLGDRLVLAEWLAGWMDRHAVFAGG